MAARDDFGYGTSTAKQKQGKLSVSTRSVLMAEPTRLDAPLVSNRTMAALGESEDSTVSAPRSTTFETRNTV
jgi:hypothetical protein